jgi:hypothetical protein
MIPLLGDLGLPDTLLFSQFHLMPLIMTFVNILALLTTVGSDRRSFVQGLAIAFVFLILLYDSPLGLLIYWTTSNLFSLGSNLAPRLTERLSIKIPLPAFRGSVVERCFEEYGYIFFVVNLAILVPLLGVLGNQFNLFTAHGMTGAAIISLFLVIALLPSAVLFFLKWLAKLLGVAKAFDGLVFGVFLGVFLTYIFNKAGYGLLPSAYEPAILFIAALLITAISVVVTLNSELLRKLSYASLVIPMVLLHFIYVSPASSLFAGSDGMRGVKPRMMSDTPVFLLVFDEFSGLTIQNSEGFLDASRYPSFGRFAENADYFPNALTVDNHTSIAVPSMLSGTMRLEGSIGPLSSAGEMGLAPGENLLELFQEWGAGVRAESTILPADLMDEKSTDLYSVASDLATLYLHIVSHQDWIEGQIGVIPSTWKGFGIFYESTAELDKAVEKRSEDTGAFFDWLDELALTPDDKQFNLLHVQYPHAPYVTTASGRLQTNAEPFLSRLLIKEEFSAGQSLINVSYHNYLQQSSFAGVMLGRYIDVLKESGLYDKSLIIVTSDHGVSFSAEGLSRREPLTKDSWKNIVSVPLFIKYPFQEKGRIDDSFVTILDIVPTIIDTASIEPPWGLAGESLRDRESNEQSKSVELIVGYKDYFTDIVSLFEGSRARKKGLFGDGSPVTDVAVNYTENTMYSALLNTELSNNSVSDPSELHAMWSGSLEPSEISRYGRVYLGTQPQNGKVVAAVVDNKIQAVFITGSIDGQTGNFAFSLPETEVIPVKNNVSLYEVEAGEELVMKKLMAYKSGQFLFQDREVISYDWKNSVESTNGLESLNVENGGISVTASSSRDPYVVMQSFSDEPIVMPTIRIELESNKDLTLQLFYQNSDELGFTEENSQVRSIKEGSNVVFFEIPETRAAGSFRLDLGSGGFTHVDIEDIEVRF